MKGQHTRLETIERTIRENQIESFNNSGSSSLNPTRYWNNRSPFIK